MENPHFRIVYVDKDSAMYLFWNVDQGIRNHSRDNAVPDERAYKGLNQERRELEDMAGDVAVLVGGPWDAIGLHINFHAIGAYPEWLKSWNLDWTDSEDWVMVGVFLVAGSGGRIIDSKAFHAKLKEVRDATIDVLNSYKCEVITIPNDAGESPDPDWFGHLAEDFGTIC